MQTNPRCFIPFGVFSLLINRCNGNWIRIATQNACYGVEITSNWFTGLISISLSSNYAFRGGPVKLYLARVASVRDTHINYPLSLPPPTVAWMCARAALSVRYVRAMRARASRRTSILQL